MSGWGRHLDDLAGAVAGLLIADLPPDPPPTDPRGTLACRDAVLAQLRDLVGSVSGVQRLQFATPHPLSVADVTQQPGPSLHHALSQLPRCTDFGQIPMDAYVVQSLPHYEQLWRHAARACVGLEAYVDALPDLPGEFAWYALRDLADLAAAVPLLDHGLSEALLPQLTADPALCTAYELLTTTPHDPVRICAGEIRVRVAPPDAALSRRGASVPPAPDLGKAMTGLVRSLTSRAGDLSLAELHATTRLLETGGLDAAAVLQRAAGALPDAAHAADGLRAVASAAEQLRQSPTKTLCPVRLDVLRHAAELQRQLGALALRERRLPGGATPTDLRRLAAPALDFARGVPAVTRALELNVSTALRTGRMLVPSAADSRNRSTLLWVPLSHHHERLDVEQPRVQTVATRLSAAGADLPGAEVPEDGQHRSQQHTDPVHAAAAAARAHAGQARARLRAVLNAHLTDRVTPLGGPLPDHPKHALATTPADVTADRSRTTGTPAPAAARAPPAGRPDVGQSRPKQLCLAAVSARAPTPRKCWRCWRRATLAERLDVGVRAELTSWRAGEPLRLRRPHRRRLHVSATAPALQTQQVEHAVADQLFACLVQRGALERPHPRVVHHHLGAGTCPQRTADAAGPKAAPAVVTLQSRCPGQRGQQLSEASGLQAGSGVGPDAPVVVQAWEGRGVP